MKIREDIIHFIVTDFYIYNKKTMKNYFLLLTISLGLSSCLDQSHTHEIQSNGMTSQGQTISMGSQSSVDVVMQMDQAWLNKDWAKLASFFADSANISMAEGQAVTPQDFITMVSDSTDETTWVMDYAYSVKPSLIEGKDMPNTRGDWVNAGFTSSDSTSYVEWYQVENGKIITFDSFKKKVK